MYDRILVPTDGSDAAKQAVGEGIALAKRFEASLDAISVVEYDNYPDRVRSELSTELATQGNRILDDVTARAEETGVDVTTQLIDPGKPVHQAIIEYGTDHDVDLLVMGTHGRTGLNRLVLGSVTERTLRMSPIPVLTVHEATAIDPAFGTILLPTDGSKMATEAATHAIELAAVTDGTLHIVHAVDLTFISGEYGSGAILDALEAAGQRAVDDLIERATEAGVQSVEASILSGAPSRAITDYATDRGVDLIVMGTHGRSGLDRYLLGSVTEKVIRLAETPVLSVSP
jgi:nucleotide-binding universal stress UspA family protein